MFSNTAPRGWATIYYTIVCVGETRLLLRYNAEMGETNCLIAYNDYNAYYLQLIATALIIACKRV